MLEARGPGPAIQSRCSVPPRRPDDGGVSEGLVVDDQMARAPGLLCALGGVSRGAEVFVPGAPGRDRFLFAGKVMDVEAIELHVGDRMRELALMEATLLRYLFRHEGKAVSRKAMLEDVWGVREDADARAVDNFIVRLRRY